MAVRTLDLPAHPLLGSPRASNIQNLHTSSILYLSAPDYRFLLKQSSEVWESSQGLPAQVRLEEDSN